MTLILALIPSVAQAEFDHSVWNRLLRDHVHLIDQYKTAVDYSALAQERRDLQQYLADLSLLNRQDFDQLGYAHQLAFLINAYNAWTVELILSEYPGLDSIRDIGFIPGAAWRRKIVSLFGEKYSLDELEHEMIRKWPQFQEPRIHFAVNCAALSCPALQPEAYTGERLDQQLESSTKRFLSDRDRNRLEGDTLYLSRIFDWYGEDFEAGWKGVNSLAEFLAAHAAELGISVEQQQALAIGNLRIRYLRYDWGLNDL